MRIISLGLGASVVALAASHAAVAGTAPFFVPLQQSAAVAPPNHVNELNSPWQTPAGIGQSNLTSMNEVEADVNQSIQRSVNRGSAASMFDMLAYDPSGRYIFIPHETSWGAGLSRYDTVTDTNHLIFAGDQEASTTSECDSSPLAAERPPTDPACPAWDYDFAAFDPSRWTPNGTVIVGEEWSGLGRVVEILDPMATPTDPVASPASENVSWRVLDSIARVAHEGINFSVKHPNEVIYYIDEWNSGSIYKLELKTPGDYMGGGQTFVLSVDAFAATGGMPNENWNSAANQGASRFGAATWVAITDADGNKLPGAAWDPFQDGPTSDPNTVPETRGGRGAADEAGGTPYGRPEDMAVGMLPNGNEILYVTTTSENAVISIELTGGQSAMVREFVSEANTPKNVGFLPTTATLNSPDNLAIDALGNVYVIEDAPNGSSVGGDIWFARDMDNDGVAESLDHFLSIQVDGSEATGMVFNPAEPNKFVVAVQHPDSTDLSNVPNGFGDAVWEFDLATVVPPTCDGPRSQWMSFDKQSRRWVRACSTANDFNFVRQLEKNDQLAPVNP